MPELSRFQGMIVKLLFGELYAAWNKAVRNEQFEKIEPLSDKTVFDTVYVDYGSTVWNNGDIDIAPEYLFENSIPA